MTAAKRHAPMMATSDIAMIMPTRPTWRSPSASTPNLGRVRGRLRPRLVQADPSRHGAARPLSGPEVPTEVLLWQDPVPAVDHPLIDRQDVAALKAKVLESGLSVAAAGLHRLEVGVDVPRHRQARWCQRRAHPPGAAEGLGGERAGRVGEGAADAGRVSSSAFNAGQVGNEGVAGRSDRAGRLRGRREGRQGRPAMPSRCRSRRAAPTRRRSRRTCIRSRVLEPKADGFRNYVGNGRRPAGGGAPGRPGAPAGLSGAGDDGAGRAACACWAPTTAARDGVFTKRPGTADQRLLRQPAGHDDDVEGGFSGRRPLRGP